MGGGHGWYTPTMMLFPLATINLAWQDQLSTPFLIAGIFQFIIYGFLIDNAKNKKNAATRDLPVKKLQFEPTAHS